MKNSDDSGQIGLLEIDDISFICQVINDLDKPTAIEIVSVCVNRLGESCKSQIKMIVAGAAHSPDVPKSKQAIFHQMMKDGSLDLALSGESNDNWNKNVNTGIDTLFESSKKYRDSNQFQEMIDFIGKFRTYAPYNNMLIKVQNPSCGFYATARDWDSQFKRKLKEDARPMLILAPMHPVMLVYDLDQTEGQDLPKELVEFSRFEGKWKDKYLTNLEKNLAKHKIQVNYKKLSSTHGGCAMNQEAGSQWKKRILIHSELDQPSRFGVLCHEAAHILLGHLGSDNDFWWPSRLALDTRAEEVEAEAVSFIVTKHLGLDGSSDAYLSKFLTKKREIPPGVSIDKIAKVSGRIKNMAEGTLPAPKVKRKK